MSGYVKFRGLDVPEDDTECESLAVIFIDSLLVYNKGIICKYI